MSLRGSFIDHIFPHPAACPQHTPSTHRLDPLPGKLRRQSNRSAPPAPGHHRESRTMGGGGDHRSKGSYPLFAHKPVGVPKTSILKDRIEPFYKSGQYDQVNLLA
ncbi:Alpha-mannosidase [Tolypocladium paradoxum]|uniref:Alpha-mannosidase n=1 Tax=Tolypocladium paradoxum TaxID=94208 RepID=A0A2S4L721_9HYPO|nr:Alpha-mannosidase [Tolypocladium paradoxum]